MYANLHAHTIYSVLDGHARVDDYVAHVKQLGHTHAAITDHGTLAGVPAFVQACAKHDLTPIVGCELYVSPAGRADNVRPNHHLTVLAINQTGYRNLLQLASRASLEGFYYKPRVDHELLAAHHEGLVVLSGCISGELGGAVLGGDDRHVTEVVGFYRDVFGDRYFFEVMDHGDFAEQRTLNQAIARLHRQTRIPVVATNDSHFCAARDYAAQQMLINVRIKDRELGSPYCYVRDNREMATLFEPSMLTTSLAIASMVERYPLGSRVPRLPMTPYELGGQDAYAVLVQLCDAGLRQRNAVEYTYTQRLESELEVIRHLSTQLGADFSRYLLMIADIVDFCRNSGIRFGPRGSAAGSLICWALGISEPDPIQHGLVFERFLNPHRVEMPDIDLDFADDRREEVFAYIQRVYGAANVGRIGTFAAIGAKQALRDAARELKENYADAYDVVDAMLKAIPDDPRPGGIPLRELIDDQRSESIMALALKEPGKSILETALQLEGRLRGEGMHAAGVVIADRPLIELVPMQRTRDTGSAIAMQTQYEMQHLEALGLLKVDILGLKTLSTLDATLARINANTFFEPIDPWYIPWNDAATWQLIQSGQTLACFQIGSEGLGKACQALKPDTLNDLALTIAVYRPGPLQNFDSIVARKHGREPIASIDPAIDGLLAETYGFPVYQEQVMEIARTFAGYSLGEADLLRKAMGKKIREKMAEEHVRFIAGAEARGHSRERAEAVWDYLLPFANYGFNKSHAVCYAYVAYQTAYLKATFPLAFYAAAMTVEAGTGGADTGQQRIGQLIREASRRGIGVLPPSIEHVSRDFAVDQGRLRYGFAAIKDVADADIDKLLAHPGPYSGLEDFLAKTRISLKSAETLAAIGAIAWHTRRSLVERQPVSGPRGGSKQMSLTGWTKTPYGTQPPELPEWPAVECLKREVTHLGMFTTPLPPPHLETTMIHELKNDPRNDRTWHTLRAVIIKTGTGVFKKSGQTFGKATVLDEAGEELELMIYPEQYQQPAIRDALVVGTIVFIHGEYRNSIYGETFVVRNFWPLTETNAC